MKHHYVTLHITHFSTAALKLSFCYNFVLRSQLCLKCATTNEHIKIKLYAICLWLSWLLCLPGAGSWRLHVNQGSFSELWCLESREHSVVAWIEFFPQEEKSERKGTCRWGQSPCWKVMVYSIGGQFLVTPDQPSWSVSLLDAEKPGPWAVQDAEGEGSLEGSVQGGSFVLI